MKAPDFKPLPSFGGTIEDRLKRSQTAAKAQEMARAAIQAEKEEELDRQIERARERAANRLTPEQIQHWRTVLCGILGPYALIAPDSTIQAIRDQFQKRLG